MEPFLFGIREDIHIFDLEQTSLYLKRALNVIQGVAKAKGIILFVNERKQFSELTRQAAVR